MRTLALAACAALLGAGAARAGDAGGPSLTSSAIREGRSIPVLFTCDGENVSPPLSWSGLPDGAKSVAITLEDPDAPAGDWVHWLVYDVPPTPPRRTTGVGAGLEGRSWGPALANAASFAKTGYQGPCPPPGRPHRYVFTLYALSRPTGLKAGATRAQLLEAIKDTTLGRATLTATYAR